MRAGRDGLTPPATFIFSVKEVRERKVKYGWFSPEVTNMLVCDVRDTKLLNQWLLQDLHYCHKQ